MPRLGGPPTTPNNNNNNNNKKKKSDDNQKSRRNNVTHILRSQFESNRHRLPRCNVRNVTIGLLVLFVLRNILAHDYQKMESEQLKSRGYTEDQIARYVKTPNLDTPRVVSEGRDEMLAIKRDINFLLREVGDLRTQLMDHGRAGDGNSESSLNDLEEMDDMHRTMDIIHMEKRLKREQDALQRNPNLREGRQRRKNPRAEADAELEKLQRAASADRKADERRRYG
eukprot:CAMPEP_0119551628 /NCGR_PEP_ID=MMETSP1352-20130426/4826_1 /TAXON_ID=265584 /ORGANISM="Stauroneis constricta, Strain CCMP1120" /LENGTH=225 /DNA_ID=CAMNT_0007597715 /DNA_START=54 /DNA_END=731 /DNA_ORIENTATION=+